MTNPDIDVSNSSSQSGSCGYIGHTLHQMDQPSQNDLQTSQLSGATTPNGEIAPNGTPIFLPKKQPLNMNNGNTDFNNKIPLPVENTGVDEDDIHRDSSSSLSSLPTPPDGGWGWIVCFGSFMCVMILDGFMFSFGVFFVDLLDYFKETKGKTAWAGSITMGMSMFTGPITSCLVTIYGTRPVSIFGALLAGVSFALSTLSPNVNVLIVLYGVFGGIGIGMIFIPAVLSVGFYFEKKRGFANGIAACGAGVGIFVFAPVSRQLLDMYGWRGALLICSGIILNCAVFGSFFRPLTKSKKRQLASNDSSKDRLLNQSDVDDKIGKKTLTPGVSLKNGLLLKKNGLLLNQKLPFTFTGSLPNELLSDNKFYSDGNLNKDGNFQDKHLPCKSKEITDYSSNKNVASEMRTRRTRTISSPSYTNYKKSKVIDSPLYRKDAFYSGSITTLPEYRSNPDIVSYRKSMLTLSSHADVNDEKVCCCIPKEASMLLAHMLDYSLFKNPVFILCVISSTLWTAQSIVMTYIGDYALVQGLTKQQGALLLAIIGVTNTASRAVIGWFCDRPFVDCVVVNTVALISAGCINLFIPLISGFPLLLTAAAVYGFCMGTWVSLRPIVLVSLLGIDKLTSAFGWLAMFQGIGFTIGPPIAGTLFDKTQSYTATFLFTGSIFIVAGILCIPLRRLVTCQKNRQIKKLQQYLQDDHL